MVKRERCSGCTACFNICPQNCIEMIEDEEGFLYPSVIEEKCTNCGLCKKVCPEDTATRHLPLSVYAVKHKASEIREQSTSGGMFTAISNFVFDNNGVVFACRWDEGMRARHDFTEDRYDIKNFRGSKYVQSELEDTFKKVKSFLRDDRFVLFVGTPCQVAGLTSFLGRDYDNLIKCDFVCHSVPSPKVFSEYIKELEVLNNSKVKDFYFREKALEGWKRSNFRFDLESGVTNREALKHNLFFKGFNSGLFNRPSCSSCSYKDFKGSSDITIGDYWGIEKVENIPQGFIDDLGVSLVIVNTAAGELVFNKIKNNLNYIETKIEDAVVKNPYILVPSPAHVNRNEFFSGIGKAGFSETIRKFLSL